MDTTFISIHDLSLDARLLYVSNSVTDILGYNPDEVIGKSCWEYFHPDEIPFAREVHGRGVRLDKAAVLNYCQIKAKSGLWVGCECVFTVVHDVLVGCTSIYRPNPRSQRRAESAPIIRQLFSSSPRDPRYHMLSYISSKFSQGPRPHIHEPRAALFLNRFTRTLTIMYATKGLEDLLGISAADMVGKSFYYCIQENCLPEALRCLESAKANDSIAYLRFWYRDPRNDEPLERNERMSDAQSSDADSDDEGGVKLTPNHESDAEMSSGSQSSLTRPSLSHQPSSQDSSHTTDEEPNTLNPSSEHITKQSSATSFSPKRMYQSPSPHPGVYRIAKDTIELEAVVSCTSDGLVVILRGARPFLPDSLRHPTRVPEPPLYKNGIFASPWATDPIIPKPVDPNVARWVEDSAMEAEAVPGISIPPAMPYLSSGEVGGAPTQFKPVDIIQSNFMSTIRDVACFAWALTGINGSLAQYGRGTPTTGAQPFSGLPVWERDAGNDMDLN